MYSLDISDIIVISTRHKLKSIKQNAKNSITKFYIARSFRV